MALLLASISGCIPALPGADQDSRVAPAVGAATGVPPVRGVVDFGDGSGRSVAATMGNIAKAATVSLIDAAINRTVSTDKTDDTGSFSLSFTGGFVPVTGKVYILEAVKGLLENRPGSNAARVRTLIQLDLGTWTSIVAGQIYLDVSTTALSIMQASYTGAIPPRTGPEADPANYIGLIAQPSGNSAVPDTLRAGQTVVNQATFEQVHSDVRSAIDLDQDPLASIQYSSGNFSLVSASIPGITAIVPDQGSAGSKVTIYGFNLTGAAVSFNGANAEVKSAGANALVVVVPADATSGPVKASTSKGTSGGVTFSILKGFAGDFKGTQ